MVVPIKYIIKNGFIYYYIYCILLDKKCFGNPIGPQGMLILGAITSAWALKNNYYSK